jgi:hypothetical protein
VATFLYGNHDNLFRIRGAALAAALTLCGSASAQAPMPNLVGEYNLLSSTTVPPSTRAIQGPCVDPSNSTTITC